MARLGRIKKRLKEGLGRPKEPLGKPDTITIHHTARNFGNRAMISLQHRARGFSGIGYHFVIGNGRFFLSRDGKVYRGRPLDKKGAHVGKRNTGNIGIAFIGNFNTRKPTERQLDAAAKLVAGLVRKYGIPVERIVGHRDFMNTECPGKNFDLHEFRERVKAELEKNRKRA